MKWLPYAIAGVSVAIGIVQSTRPSAQTAPSFVAPPENCIIGDMPCVKLQATVTAPLAPCADGPQK